MSLLNPKVKIAPLLEGFTDRHCHILPGVDDGYKSMEQSLHTLGLYEKAGISEVWFTPHVMDDYPNTTEGLKTRFEELCAQYKGSLKLHLSTENMMDMVMDDRLRHNDFLCQAERHLLVETSYFNPPIDLWGTIEKIKSLGYFPMLAHPERYVYMGEKDYKELKAKGVLFQLNISSLYGAYGEGVKEKAEILLKKGWYDYAGTDLHRERSFLHLQEAVIRKKYFKLLKALVEKDR